MHLNNSYGNFLLKINPSHPNNPYYISNLSYQMENASTDLKDSISISGSFSNNTFPFDFTWIPCFGAAAPPNHILFQIANLFFLLSFVPPATGLHGLLYLRSCLMIGSLFFSIWGWLIACALDTFIWNSAFTFLNLIHLAIVLYLLRPVRFSIDVDAVYRDLFKPLKVSRHQFKTALNCMREIKHLKPREPYCVENVTKVDRLSLVISGRMVVSQNGHGLHIIDSKQFLDSPEWFGVCTNDTYQVSITAIEESSVIVWHRDKLKLSISNDAFLQAVFDNVLGKDVVKKLLLVSENPCNGVGYYAYEDMVAETTKLLSKSKQGQSGLGVLLTRQVKNRDTNVWNLSKGEKINCEPETSV